MKKEKNPNTEAQLLELLKKVLPKATHDPKLAGQIYQAIEAELRAKGRAKAFDKFCSRAELRDFEPQSIAEIKQQLTAAFGEADITVKPHRQEKFLTVEMALPDGAQFSGEIRVDPNPMPQDDGEPEVTLKFIPFPVCLPGDKELVWMLAKREDLSPEEAGIALTKLQEEFWASKTGQKLLRDRVERSFSEFISRVPGGSLSEVGLKRHYKTPEAIKVLRRG
jgi:hypothetical protein